MASSGNTARSAPAAAAVARADTIRSALPPRSPTTVLSWHRATRITVIRRPGYGPPVAAVPWLPFPGCRPLAAVSGGRPALPSLAAVPRLPFQAVLNWATLGQLGVKSFKNLALYVP